jgi:hypothetical protein
MLSMHIREPSKTTREVEAEDHKFEASLGYKVRTIWKKRVASFFK